MFIAVQPALRNSECPTRGQHSEWRMWVGSEALFLAVSDNRLLKDDLERRVFFNPHHFRIVQYRQVKISLCRTFLTFWFDIFHMSKWGMEHGQCLEEGEAILKQIHDRDWTNLPEYSTGQSARRLHSRTEAHLSDGNWLSPLNRPEKPITAESCSFLYLTLRVMADGWEEWVSVQVRGKRGKEDKEAQGDDTRSASVPHGEPWCTTDMNSTLSRASM